MRQTILNLWQKEYSNDLILTKSNESAYNFILNENVSCLLTGPNFCGKKHLAYKVALEKNIKIVLFDQLSDCEIIKEYDLCKANGIQSLWIGNKFIIKKNDIASRLDALYTLKIEELDFEDMQTMLKQRLLYQGFKINSYHLKICSIKLNCMYEDVHRFIEHIKLHNKLNNKIVHSYFKI